MGDRPKGDQFTPNPELAPTQGIVDVLRGTISGPVKTISHKPGQVGQEVEVRLAVDGPGMFGLEDWRDNKEWSGVFNHVAMSARLADHLAQCLQSSGQMVDRQTLMDSMIASHPGRRQWDEAGWYPDVVAKLVGTEERWLRANMTNEQLGLRLIGNKVPNEVFNLVAALAHGPYSNMIPEEVYRSPEYKLAIYADHRTSQKFEPLNTRIGDFLLSNFISPALADVVRAKVYEDMNYIISAQRVYSLNGLPGYSLFVADDIAAQNHASESSSRLSRRELMALILQDADTEAMLIKAGVDVDSINEETVPIPRWEGNLRKEYVAAATQDLREVWGQGSSDRFPQNTWWGQYAAELAQSSV